MTDSTDTVICECGDKTIAEATEIFQGTSLPYKKAKKLVTGCNRTCCRLPLRKLFDMVYFGKIDNTEINRLILVQNNNLDLMIETLKPESDQWSGS